MQLPIGCCKHVSHHVFCYPVVYSFSSINYALIDAILLCSYHALKTWKSLMAPMTSSGCHDILYRLYEVVTFQVKVFIRPHGVVFTRVFFVFFNLFIYLFLFFKYNRLLISSFTWVFNFSIQLVLLLGDNWCTCIYTCRATKTRKVCV